MLQLIVLVDVVQWASQFPVALHSEVLPFVVVAGKLAETVGRLVVEYAHQSACTNAAGTGTQVATIGETGIDQEVDVLGQLHIDFGIHIGAAHSGVGDDTVLVVLGERGAEAQFLVTAIHGYVVHLGQGWVAHQLVLPVVGGLSLVDVKVVGVAEVAAEGVLLAVVVVCGIQLVLHKLVSVKHFLLAGQPRKLSVGVEVYLHLTSLGRLGGYDNNTVTTSGTINGGQGSILQYVDALDVGRRNVVDVVCLETINNVQRFGIL